MLGVIGRMLAWQANLRLRQREEERGALQRLAQSRDRGEALKATAAPSPPVTTEATLHVVTRPHDAPGRLAQLDDRAPQG